MQIHDLVEQRGDDPQTVAERFDLDLADVYHALAYFHDHPGEMKAARERRQDSLEQVRENTDSPDGVAPE